MAWQMCRVFHAIRNGNQPFRSLIYAEGDEIWIEHSDLDSRPIEISNNLRITLAYYIGNG